MTLKANAEPVGTCDDTAPMQTFYVVSKSKLILLFLLTAGMYFSYWIYRNWKLYRVATDSKIWPLIRAAMGVLFIYSLFLRIDRRLRSTGALYSWSPRLLALGFIFSTCVGMSGQVWLSGMSGHFVFVLMLGHLLFNMCCLLKVQNAINHLENDANGQSNSTLSPLNYVWIALGICWWGWMIPAALWPNV